ncbi:MAG: beta-ketoacyl-[acyl-carrier-protein] synthase family protein, partial [Gemmataceae bacterium]|nr:beta-ketoacyl-[acyl-carrier-protein] synthase family protein [Gemmataceae bacterium]
MATTTRRAVLTGFGVLSPIGSTPAAFWDGLLANASAVRVVKAFDGSALPCHVGGEIPDFSAKTLIEKSFRKSLNAMARTVQLGVVAAQLAMQDAGLPRGAVAAERLGVEFASVMGPTDLDDLAAASKLASVAEHTPVDMEVWGRDGLPVVPPMWMLKYLPNMPACHFTIMFDAQGPSNTLIPNDAAGVLAFGEALRIVQRGAADVMLVGGSESKIHPLSMTRFNGFATLTRRNDAPERAIRPFDRDHDGTALGEGGAAFTLETLDHARARGAKVIGEVVGFAAGVDRGLTGPGLARVIRNALANAGVAPADVDHVNAHGTGVPHLDAFEARGIAGVFGTDVPVFAPLSRFGDMGAAAGVVETACSVVALQRGQLPGTVNHENADPACPVRVHTGDPRPVTVPAVSSHRRTPRTPRCQVASGSIAK